jgi:hypothetical protein
MTQYTPPAQIDYGYGAAPRRTSGAAIASLVLGIVGCVPFITGILAIVLGVIGIRKTREPTVGGKGLAIAGLILGIISVAGWSVCGAALGIGYVESPPASLVAKQFLQDVAAGNTNGAMSNSVNFTAAEIQSETASMAAYGALQSIRITSFFFTSSNGQTVLLLSGSALYSNGPRICSFRLVKQGGVYKVAGYKVY